MPKSRALLDELERLCYKGPVGHVDGVLSIAYDHESGEVVTAGRDGLKFWTVGFAGTTMSFHFTSRLNRPDLQPSRGPDVAYPWHALPVVGPLPMAAYPSHDKASVARALSIYSGRLLLGSSKGEVVEVDLSTGSSLERRMLAQGHGEGIEALAVHPHHPEACSVGRDGSCMLWILEDEHGREWHALRGMGQLPAGATSVAYHPSGDGVIVAGLETGDLIGLSFDDDGLMKVLFRKSLLGASHGGSRSNSLTTSGSGMQGGNTASLIDNSSSNGYKSGALTISRSQGQGGLTQSNAGGLGNPNSGMGPPPNRLMGPRRPVPGLSEVTALSFSPSGQWLAAALGQHLLLLDASRKYRRVAVGKGHAGCISAVDWEEGEEGLQSNDVNHEVMVWRLEHRLTDTPKIKSLIHPSEARDHKWRSLTCVLAWPTMSLWKRYNGPGGRGGEAETCTHIQRHAGIHTHADIQKTSLPAFVIRLVSN